jgi:adenine-specific DNA-methyltransferase
MAIVIEKLELNSMSITDDKRARLKELIPEAFTEGGKVDFDRLKLSLGEIVDVGKERYGMNWPGKADCFRTLQTPSIATLRPCPEESVKFEVTGNVIIEGDNLEVLKLLQKSYMGKIKMIYIDPPYNTGGDFIYPDNYTETLETYLQYTGQVDAHGKKFGTNTEADGRFHSKWLNMMYPRLFLAKNLLRDDGLIFVSIDDHEEDNLRKVMNEIFGEDNICATFVWNTEGNTDNQYAIKVNHEYVLAYYKNSAFSAQAVGHVIDPNTREDSNLWKGLADNNINKNNPENPPEIVELPAGFPSKEEELHYSKKDVDEEFFEATRRDKYISDKIKAKYKIEKLSGLPVKLDDMIVKEHRLTQSCRIYGGMANKNKLLEFIKNGCNSITDDDGQPLRFYINANAAVRYHRQNEKPQNILSVLRNMGTTERTRGYLKQFDIYYDYPKPLPLIEYLVRIGCEPTDGIVLDFFSGSGTTAEAVANVNTKDGGFRKFICVQLPEQCEDVGFANIAEIGKERLRRVLRTEAGGEQGNLPIAESLPDRGFAVFKLAESNFKPWNAEVPHSPDTLERQLELHVSHVREGRTDQDILYEILFKSGYPLTTPVETILLADKTVYSVAGGQLLICLERELTLELIRAIAQGKPERVVCLDEGFAGNDQLKTNAAHIFEPTDRREAKSDARRFRTV